MIDPKTTVSLKVVIGLWISKRIFLWLKITTLLPFSLVY